MFGEFVCQYSNEEYLEGMTLPRVTRQRARDRNNATFCKHLKKFSKPTVLYCIVFITLFVLPIAFCVNIQRIFVSSVSRIFLSFKGKSKSVFFSVLSYIDSKLKFLWPGNNLAIKEDTRRLPPSAK